MEGKVVMKRKGKIFICILFFAISFFLTGCINETADPNAPANLKKITGEIENAQVDASGDIIIDKEEITDQVRYYNYEFEDVIIGLLAVRDSKGNVRVVVNTCSSCQGSPYAYFVQVGNKVQCQNCGSLFDIDSLGEEDQLGCNPIGIENKTETESQIIISHVEIEQYKEKFENWKGPKL